MGEELVSGQFDDKFVLVGQFLLVLLDGLVLFVQLACYRLDVLSQALHLSFQLLLYPSCLLLLQLQTLYLLPVSF